MAVDSLTDDENAILTLDGKRFDTASGKDDAIRDLGMSPVRYYQRLNQLVETEAALAFDPVTVNRLRRIRSQRAENRQCALT